MIKKTELVHLRNIQTCSGLHTVDPEIMRAKTMLGVSNPKCTRPFI